MESEFLAACSSGDIDAVNRMLESPSAQDLMRYRDHLERLAIHLAAYQNRPSVVTRLLEAGASANATAKQGFSALHFAVQSGARDSVAALLKGGASANVWEVRKKHTPLHLAALKGQAEIVRILLQSGANPLAKTKQGKTPFDLVLPSKDQKAAPEENSEAVREALRAHLDEMQRATNSTSANVTTDDAIDTTANTYTTSSSVVNVNDDVVAAISKGSCESSPLVAENDEDASSVLQSDRSTSLMKHDAPNLEPRHEASSATKAVISLSVLSETCSADVVEASKTEPPPKKRRKERKQKTLALSLSHLEHDDGFF